MLRLSQIPVKFGRSLSEKKSSDQTRPPINQPPLHDNQSAKSESSFCGIGLIIEVLPAVACRTSKCPVSTPDHPPTVKVSQTTDLPVNFRNNFPSQSLDVCTQKTRPGCRDSQQCQISQVRQRRLFNGTPGRASIGYIEIAPSLRTWFTAIFSVPARIADFHTSSQSHFSPPYREPVTVSFQPLLDVAKKQSHNHTSK